MRPDLNRKLIEGIILGRRTLRMGLRARRREESENTYVYSKTVARREAVKIAVATVVSPRFPARFPRGRCSYTGPG